MAEIDLQDCIPEVLAEKAELSDLLEAVQRITEWQDRHAEILDHIYRQRLLRLIRSGNESGELQKLLEHLDIITHPDRLQKLNGLNRAYGERWQAYMDIIDSHLAALSSDAPEELLKRAHVREILDMVADGRVQTRKEIVERLGLRPANLTRVLNLMEANELIQRHSEGREKRLKTGPMAARFFGRRESHDDEVPRGIRYLSKTG